MSYYGMQFRTVHHSNKTLFWHAATTCVVFSLMTGLCKLYALSNPIGLVMLLWNKTNVHSVQQSRGEGLGTVVPNNMLYPAITSNLMVLTKYIIASLIDKTCKKHRF